MRPKHIPESMVRGKSPRFLPKHIKCPPGSVLIKRTTQEDLIMDKKIKALGLINYPTSSHFNTTGAGPIDLTVGNAVSKIYHKFDYWFYILPYMYIYTVFSTRSSMVFFLSVCTVCCCSLCKAQFWSKNNHERVEPDYFI